MESRAKQRLTGAVILVALFVLLVPELLTGPRDADTPEARDQTTRACAATPSTSMRRHPPAQRRQRCRAGTASRCLRLPTDRAQPGEAAAPARQRRAGCPRPAPQPRAEPQKPPVRRQPVSQRSRPHAPARTQSAPTHAPPSADRRASRGSFVVQLGTFGNRENADRLVRDMTAKGFAAFVAPTTTNGHELYRVRVGPTRDRASAEALAAQLRRVGQSGSIVPIS